MRKLILTVLVLSSGILKAQEPTPAAKADNSEANRKFGLGIKTFNLTSDIIENPLMTPGNKIVITINPHKNFRLQPEVGYIRSKAKSTQYKDGVIDKALALGCGAFYMWQKEKTNLYIGLKYMYVNNEDQSLYYSGTGSSYQVFTTTTNTHAYGLTAGGEYMLGKHFSLGAEASFLRATSKYSDTYPGSIAQEAAFYFTETNLLARFYF